MPSITRQGECPIYIEYLTRNILVPSRELTSDNQEFFSYNFDFIDIPLYQRGISWKTENINEFIHTDSRLMGNAVMGQFSINKGDLKFEHVPSNITQYFLLIDGLQRFSIGTCILSILHKYFLSDEPDYPEQSGFYSTLKNHISNKISIIRHNDYELSNHSRNVVKSSYNVVKSKIKKYLDEEALEGDGKAFSQKLTELFILKQISPDKYHGFKSTAELANSFIGINTLRVELNDIDLLRSIILEKAIEAQWQEGELLTIENKITETFQKSPKSSRELQPFISIIKVLLIEDQKADLIFKTWGFKTLKFQEVDDFLNYVQYIDRLELCNYINEIKQIGGIPYAGILLYYYREYIMKDYPTSDVESIIEKNKSIHYDYCRAFYRVLIDGKIARSRTFVEALLIDDEEDLHSVSRKVSEYFLKVKLSNNVQRDWLSSRLRGTKKSRARRIFNACRLKPLNNNLDDDFEIDEYGAENHQLHIDHLYPKAAIEKDKSGASEADTICNFAPLTSDFNRKEKDTPCSEKLNKNGSYSQYLNTNSNPHPYCKWLVENQGNYFSNLDRQELLVTNSNPNIGDERLSWLTDYLIERL